MRVLLINKFHYGKGGAERAYFDTAHILAEKGHEVAFFAMEHPNNQATPWSRYFVKHVEYLDQEQSVFSKVRIGLRILWNFEAYRKLSALIREFQPDVAHLHNTYHQLSPSILWALKKYRIPVVMTLHDYKAVSPNYSLFVRGKLWLSTSGWRAIVDRAVKDSVIRSAICALETWLHRLLGSYRTVDRFIAPSHFLIEEYQKLGFSHPIQYIPQPLFPFPKTPHPVGKGDYFLFVGRLSAEKGVETILEAAQKLPDQKFIIVGTGPTEPKLKAFQKQQGLKNIEFVGYQTGAPLEELFRNAKALLLPSIWYENMPYVMLEAFGYGKPVIGSNLGGIPERIIEGKNGFLFEPGQVDSLVRAIHMFESHDRAQLSQRAWQSIQHLQPDAYYRTLFELYWELT